MWKLYIRGGEPAVREPNAASVNILYDRVGIFVTQVRVQYRVKAKLHDKQVLR